MELNNCKRKCVDKDTLATVEQYRTDILETKAQCNPVYTMCMETLDDNKSAFACDDEIDKCVDDSLKVE